MQTFLIYFQIEKIKTECGEGQLVLDLVVQPGVKIWDEKQQKCVKTNAGEWGSMHRQQPINPKYFPEGSRAWVDPDSMIKPIM